ncbi:hypothetical protein E2C01_085043 [Portunus trituberculatus]|uniref:Uncharacterized protein n=1 Tax=Portunus trituberculatus TaxID=210409 RepID=A0A5B7J7U5_PORTR|nr:hypothetical protein [Portunus trituberculatus]
MTINHSKTVGCTSASPRRHYFLPSSLWVVWSTKLLSVTVDDHLTWKLHVTTTVNEVNDLQIVHATQTSPRPGDTGRNLTGNVPHLHPPQAHVCLTSVVLCHLYSTAAAGECAKGACRVILGSANTNCDDALTTLSMLKVSTRQRESLEKLWRSLLHHPCLRHLLPADAPRPVRATRHRNRIILLCALRTVRCHLSGIRTMVKAINY